MKSLAIILCIAVTMCTSSEISEISNQKNNDFSIKIHQDLMKHKDGNFVFQIFPLEVIMGLMYFGSKGDTALQIKTALGWNSSDEQITKYFESAIKQLKNIHHVHSSNRIYVSNRFHLNSAFIEKASHFDVDIVKVNFSAAEATTKLINSWVEKQTDKKINNCIGENLFTPETDLVLLNNVYIETNWLHGFKNKCTENMYFHISKNESVIVKAIKVTGHFMVARDPLLRVKMVKLPFAHEKAYMLIVLAEDKDAVDSIEENASQFWQNRQFTNQYITLYLPKFQITSTLDIVPTMKNLGISNLFSKADLSGITDKESKVNIISQNTYVEVENKNDVDDLPISDNHELHKPDGQVFKVNHPFVFGILSETDLSIIFGRITRI